MPDESYIAWVNIFDKDLTNAYSQERKELKSAAMIFCALQREFERIKTSAEIELNDIRIDLQEKDRSLEKRQKLSLKAKENTPPVASKSCSHISPIPKNISGTAKFHKSPVSTAIPVIDLSDAADEETEILTPSPTFKKKKLLKHKPTQSMCFIPNPQVSKVEKKKAQVNLLDSTVIPATPEDKPRRVKTIKANLFLSKRKVVNSKKSEIIGDNSTIIQFFNPVGSSSKISEQEEFFGKLCSRSARISEEKSSLDVTNIDDSQEKPNFNETVMAEEKDNGQELFFKNLCVRNSKVRTQESEMDSSPDPTQVNSIDIMEKNKSMMGITRMLELVNDKDNADKVEDEEAQFGLNDINWDETDINMDNTNAECGIGDTNINEEDLNFSFSSSNNDESYETPLKKNKSNNFNEPVRGKARKNLPGWSCKECKNFYEYMNLAPEELEKKMNECSRHRGNVQVDTIPGFWDMTIRTQD